MRAPSEAALSSYAPNESIAGVHHALSGSFSRGASYKAGRVSACCVPVPGSPADCLAMHWVSAGYCRGSEAEDLRLTRLRVVRLFP
jgi:hypothetical protein